VNKNFIIKEYLGLLGLCSTRGPYNIGITNSFYIKYINGECQQSKTTQDDSVPGGESAADAAPD